MSGEVYFLGIKITPICDFIGMKDFCLKYPTFAFWAHLTMLLIVVGIICLGIYLLVTDKRLTKGQIRFLCIGLQILLLAFSVVLFFGGSWVAWIVLIFFILVFIFHRFHCR